MPSVTVKLHSMFFKFLAKHRLQNLAQQCQASLDDHVDPFGITSRSDEPVAAANPTFADGVATKDLHIDPLTSLSLRLFLPQASLAASADSIDSGRSGAYKGYSPAVEHRHRKLPVILQFHGGGFVSGRCDSAANDAFCRRISKLCDAVVIAVGYRLAPENRYPAAFEDGLAALNWLAKQANLADNVRGVGGETRRLDGRRHIIDAFGTAMVEPWLSAHADPSRCVLLGVSCGANIADYLARKAIEAGKLLDPVKVVAQVLMYPFFIGSVPTDSETRLANSYFYDKATCMMAWRLFLPEEEFRLDHPATSPLIPAVRGAPPLKRMPPTLTIVAELDWMRDRAIAYSEELRTLNVDAPLLEYKDAVHGFATLDALIKTPQARACAEDISLWVKKYISQRGHEFSY